MKKEKELKNEKHQPEAEEQLENQSGNEEIDELKAELARLKDSYLRKAAEFDNYKRRADNEISNYIKFASEELIKSLLPVYDDLGRSIDSINKGETKDFETLRKGVELIYDKFKKVLEEEGVTEINSLGQPFNVDTSNALLQLPKEDAEPNTVVEVIEKGYKLKDKVIRHEKVIVSTEPL